MILCRTRAIPISKEQHKWTLLYYFFNVIFLFPRQQRGEQSLGYFLILEYFLTVMLSKSKGGQSRSSVTIMEIEFPFSRHSFDFRPLELKQLSPCVYTCRTTGQFYNIYSTIRKRLIKISVVWSVNQLRGGCSHFNSPDAIKSYPLRRKLGDFLLEDKRI